MPDPSSQVYLDSQPFLSNNRTEPQHLSYSEWFCIHDAKGRILGTRLKNQSYLSCFPSAGSVTMQTRKKDLRSHLTGGCNTPSDLPCVHSI